MAPLLVDALKRLEYRGYDSAGVATLEDGHLTRRRAEGKLRNLEEQARPRAARRPVRHRPHALGDPRRADRDATPIRTRPSGVALVHNGIIENFRELKTELEARRRARSRPTTDTEVIAHLITAQARQRA